MGKKEKKVAGEKVTKCASNSVLQLDCYYFLVMRLLHLEVPSRNSAGVGHLTTSLMRNGGWTLLGDESINIMPFLNCCLPERSGKAGKWPPTPQSSAFFWPHSASSPLGEATYGLWPKHGEKSGAGHGLSILRWIKQLNFHIFWVDHFYFSSSCHQAYSRLIVYGSGLERSNFFKMQNNKKKKKKETEATS